MMKQVGGESSPPFIFIKKEFGLIMQYVNITYVRFNYHKNLGNNQDFIIQKKEIAVIIRFSNYILCLVLKKEFLLTHVDRLSIKEVHNV